MTECERIIQTGFVSDEFLAEEVRDEYTVTETTKKVWLIEMDLLREFVRVCDKFGFRYWLAFGSLLGAIRHKGMIPWDDDLDVWMPREDYEKLLSLPSSEFAAPYFLQTTLNDNDYYNAFARLRNSNTTGILVSGKNKCNNGIYLDIIPLDGMSEKDSVSKFRFKAAHVQNVIAHAYIYNVNPSIITRTIHKVLHFPLCRYSLSKTYQRVNKIASKTKWEDTDCVGITVYRAYAFEKIKFNKADFENSVLVPFEHMMVAVPAGYDNVLRTLYGDYMKFPPVEKRGNWHHFVFEPDVPYIEYEYVK